MMGESTLRKLWPHGDDKVPGLIAGIAAAAATVFPKYGLTTPLTVAHFMSQASHEAGAGLEMTENLNYTAAGIARTWPSRFNSATALPYAHNPQALANSVYGGRMGNAPAPSNDGWNYRGRGLSQVTGKEGYQKLAAKTGLDILNDPDLVSSPEYALECGVADFIICGCLPFAERDDVRGVTHHLNGGYIGLDQREQWLAKWKAALGAESAPRPSDGVLRIGDKGFEVEAAQKRLSDLGYALGDTDGDYGSKTRDAVLAFQADRGLNLTGAVDAATKAAMARDLQRPQVEERAMASADDLRALGSQTVKQADGIGTVAKAGVAAGGLGAAGQSGVLDQVSDQVNKLGGPRSVIDLIKPVAEWVATHWWVALLFVCAGAWWYARKVIAERLDDHRTGVNLGR